MAPERGLWNQQFVRDVEITARRPQEGLGCKLARIHKPTKITRPAKDAFEVFDLCDCRHCSCCCADAVQALQI